MYYLGFIGFWQWIIITLTMVYLFLTIIALIDILRSDFKGNNKLIWVLVVIFFNLLGILLYLTIGRQQKVTKTDT